MVCGVSVTSANVAPSTVTHGRNLHQPRNIRRCLAIRTTERHLTAIIVDLNVSTLGFLLSRIKARAIQKLIGKGAGIEL